MRSPTLKFQELLRRLGVEGGGQGLEIIPAVQPVVSVGDTDALVPVLAPPTSLVGGEVTGGGTAPTRPACQLSTRGIGLAVELHWSQNVTGRIRFAISPQDTPILTLTSVVATIDQPIGGGGALPPTGARHLLELGQASVGLIGTSRPTLQANQNTEVLFIFYLPSGFILELGTETTTAACPMYAIVAELELA